MNPKRLKIPSKGMKISNGRMWHFERIASSSVFLKGIIRDESDHIFRSKASVYTFQRIILIWTKCSDHNIIHSENSNLFYNCICQEI